MTDAAKVAAGLVAFVAIVLVFTDGTYAADNPEEPPPDPERPILRWILMGDPAHLVRGERYRGCVRIPILSPSVDSVRARAEKAGFRDVRVYEQQPRGDGWWTASCDYYVEATWDRPDEALDVPGVVKFAWQVA